MTIDGAARRMRHRMLKVYKECDPLAERGAAKMHATCTRGCAACCRLLVMASLAEAVTIAIYLLSDPEWRAELPAFRERIEAHILAYNDPELTVGSHFDKQLPCVFLGADETCRIYSVRPAHCRYHYVVSDPRNCSFGADDPVTARINLDSLRNHVLDAAVTAAPPGGRMFLAPLPVIVYTALVMLSSDEANFTELLGHDVPRRVLDLRAWIHLERDM